MRDQAARLFLVPQAIADARLGAPGPSAPLFGGGAADPHGRQTGQAAGRLETRHARQAAVDHHTHAFDGQAGLGHRGRQHQLAPPRLGGLHGPVLLGAVQTAVQGDDIDGRQTQPLADKTRYPVDLALPRQKGQDRARLFAQRQQTGAGHRLFEPFGRIAAQIAGLDRKDPAFGFYDRRQVA